MIRPQSRKGFFPFHARAPKNLHGHFPVREELHLPPLARHGDFHHDRLIPWPRQPIEDFGGVQGVQEVQQFLQTVVYRCAI